ncbi:UvrD-helicase domain-containing protein, partial [Corynebacterium sp.]|uniref:HelD family protein n=1 Tax=Corynebacterium sp. TaxID=1720 RepID=UPI0026DFEDB8
MVRSFQEVRTQVSNHNEIAHEQDYVDDLFARLDAEVTAANERLRQVQLEVDPANPDADALIRRETEYHGLNSKLDRLNLAQLGLVFGRIDIDDPGTEPENPVPGQPELDRRYIGRMGLDVREEGYRTLLLDWRVPMARPFYLATTAQPEGVHLRRHIRTTGRKVTGIDDEWLSGPSAGDSREGVGGESALFQAMQAARTGHMKSIVETIQREQDLIIRDDTRGVMVVEGGPGTGKTAVALHRVAYLLYTAREQLSKSGVLIVGPNSTFLDYISRVLPELGETGVVLSTIGDLYPGVSGSAPESLL